MCTGVGRLAGLRLALVGLLWFVGMTTGCAMRTMRAQVETLDRAVTVLQGRIGSEGWGGDPIVVVLSREAPAGGLYEIDMRLHYRPGAFLFVMREGAFQLAAFEDRNGDLVYQPGEPALAHGDPTSFTLKGGEENRGLDLKGPFATETVLGDRFDTSFQSGATRSGLIQRNLGVVVSLDDRRLSLEMGSKGLWQPAVYLQEVGTGIFFLEEYDPDKIPVLFVHGIAGSPAQFRYMVDGLDRDRYQPWLFAYPSSFPLAFVGGALNDMLNLLQQRHGFERLHVVAHSMGALVARAYINEYIHQGRHDYLERFVSLSAPWDGADFAAYYYERPTPLELLGLRSAAHTDLAPAAAPLPFAETGAGAPKDRDKPHISWVDLAPGSDFLRSLLRLPLPEGVDYYLAWGWKGGVPMESGSGDGAIAQGSLLRPEAQLQALQQFGGDWTHAGILEAEPAIERVMDWLDRQARGT